ncbi:MAG: VanZ family protein [Hydrogenophilaceae bacterium]|nr:VanZ family protein [Hydrogenophilaceae bacterium]
MQHLADMFDWYARYRLLQLPATMPLHRLALLPAFLLLVMYFWGNSQPEAAGLIPAPWDKLAHLAWYAVLSGLLLTGFGRRAWPWIFTAMLLLAGWDEWHQATLPGR